MSEIITGAEFFVADIILILFMKKPLLQHVAAVRPAPALGIGIALERSGSMGITWDRSVSVR